MWSHLKEKGIKLPNITAAEIDKKVEPVLREIEKNGIKLDVAMVNKIAKTTETEAQKLEKKICSLAGQEFNVNSPSQMAEVLFGKLKLSTSDLKKTKSGYSTAASELRKIEKEHKIISLILEYRELSKLLSTYLRPLPLLVDKNERLHTHYGLDTSTGRLNSSDPNLQNIPINGERGGEIRKSFIAEKGNLLISADYSQIELRIVSCLADDKVMKEAFLGHEDIHTRTASEIFNMPAKSVTSKERRVAKTVNFGVLYGQSPYGLSQTLGIDQTEAAKYIKKYFEVHSGIKDYCQKMREKAKKDGYVETLFGFRRELPNINSPYRGVAEGEGRMAINTPIQGTAAEIIKLSMIELSKELSVTSDQFSVRPRILLSIHDELVVEASEKDAKKVAALVKDVMENIVKLCVPLEVEVGIGKNWGETKKL